MTPYNLSVSTGIVDNDAEGTTGVGSIYWLEIEVNGVLECRHEFGLVDQLSGKFNKEVILSPHLQKADAWKKFQDTQEKLQKQSARQERLDAVSIDPALDKIVSTIIQNNSKIAQEIIGGKEKAINSLVGMVIGEIKKQQLSNLADAFTISIAIKQKLQQAKS